MKDCPICLSQIENPYFLSCGHVFCTECIFDWATTSKNTCPMCREYINELIIYNRNIVAVPVLKEIGMTLYHGCCYNKKCICISNSKWNMFDYSHIVSVDGHTNDEIDTLFKIRNIVNNVKKENRMCNIICFSVCPYI